MFSNDSDLEPMDIGAVNATPALKGTRGSNRRQPMNSAPKKPAGRAEQRICFFCERQGHIFRDCRRMKRAKELEKQDFEQRRQGSKQGEQGNARAPTQRAAQ